MLLLFFIFFLKKWAFMENFQFPPGVCEGFHHCPLQSLREPDLINNIAKATFDLLSPGLSFEHTAVQTPTILVLSFATLKSVYETADISKAKVFMSK